MKNKGLEARVKELEERHNTGVFAVKLVFAIAATIFGWWLAGQVFLRDVSDIPFAYAVGIVIGLAVPLCIALWWLASEFDR